MPQKETRSAGGVSIRMAEPEDAPAITRIYNIGIGERTATFETEPRTVAQIAGRLAALDRYPLLVAVDASADGAVVGWAGLSEYRARQCYADIAEFSIYLAPDVRGRGTGTALLLALVDAARDWGFRKLVSRIFPFNTPSRALCRACGFREVGVYEKHGQLDGRWLDTVIVERLIEPPPNGSR
jgi:L-amino acid N-acyltransferase YncA